MDRFHLSDFRKTVLGLVVVFVLFNTMGFSLTKNRFEYDELRTFRPAIAHAINQGRFLPQFYFYPSTYFYVGYAAAVVVGSIRYVREPIGLWKETLIRYAVSRDFVVLMRKINVVLSSLTLIWVFGLVFLLRKNGFYALMGASMLVASPDILRFSAMFRIDTIMMMFMALTMLLLSKADNSKNKPFWYRLAAASAGLSAGAKYPGGLVLLSVLGSCWLQHHRGLLKISIQKMCFEIMLIAGAVFTMTTPGIVLEPQFVWTGVARVLSVAYSGEGNSPVHIVDSGIVSFLRIMRYIFLSLPSRHLELALFVGVMASLGSVSWARENFSEFMIFILPTFVLILIFSSSVVFYERYFQFVAPFGAVLAVRGIESLRLWLKGELHRKVWDVLVVSVIVAHLLDTVQWAL